MSRPPLRTEPFAHSFFASARKRFSERESVKALEELIKLVQDFGYEDQRIPREPGASFNPRPARVGKLYLELVEAPEIDGLRCTMRMALGIEDPDLSHSEKFGCVILDDIRHLHMMNSSLQQKRDTLIQAQRTVDNLASQVALRNKLSSAIERCLRYQGLNLS